MFRLISLFFILPLSLCLAEDNFDYISIKRVEAQLEVSKFYKPIETISSDGDYFSGHGYSLELGNSLGYWGILHLSIEKTFTSVLSKSKTLDISDRPNKTFTSKKQRYYSFEYNIKFNFFDHAPMVYIWTGLTAAAFEVPNNKKFDYGFSYGMDFELVHFFLFWFSKKGAGDRLGLFKYPGKPRFDIYARVSVTHLFNRKEKMYQSSGGVRFYY